MSRLSRQQGFSLVEIMVALIIGLFVLAGVGSVYVTGKRSYQARDGLSLLQENGRTAIRLIEQTVMRAGYPLADELEPVVHDEDFIAGLELAGSVDPRLLPSEDGGGAGSDTLTVAYRPVAGGAWEAADDCLGDASQYKDMVLSRFFVRRGTLYCQGSSNATAQPLVDGIVNMQVEYGIDVNDDGFVDRYASFSEVADADARNQPQDAWQHVVSIRVSLLVRSGENVLDQPGEAKVSVGPEEVTIPTEQRRQLFRVFSTTIPLRNRMPIL